MFVSVMLSEITAISLLCLEQVHASEATNDATQRGTDPLLVYELCSQ